jgi:hypothetical protein
MRGLLQEIAQQGPISHPFFFHGAFLLRKSKQPPYMLIFFQTLLTKGSAGESLLDKPCRGKTSSSTRLDR